MRFLLFCDLIEFFQRVTSFNHNHYDIETLHIGENLLDKELFPKISTIKFQNNKLEIQLKGVDRSVRYAGIFIECFIETKLGDELHVTSPMFIAPDDYRLI